MAKMRFSLELPKHNLRRAHPVQTRVQNSHPIYDQNGQNRSPYLGVHKHIYTPYKGVLPLELDLVRVDPLNR